MTNDEAQRKMDFILDQQAQFSADVDHLKELHTQAEKRFATIEDTLTRIAIATLTLTERVTEITAAQVLMDRKMVELAQSHTKLADSQTQLAESQEHTDQRLNALIDIVKDNMNGRR